MADMKDLHVLSPEDRDKLKNQPSKRYPTGKRNAAIIVVLDRCGLRVSEALKLSLKDYNARRGELRIRKSKRDKNRTVGVHEEAQLLIERWLTVRPESKFLFCTLQGKPLDRFYIHRMLQRVAEKAGVEDHVHSHLFRHGFATRHWKKFQDVDALQSELGHSRYDTTRRYIHRTLEERVEMVKALD